jgi:hypothetical protein
MLYSISFHHQVPSVRINKKEALLGSDPHPCRQLYWKHQTTYWKDHTQTHLAQGYLSIHLFKLPLAIVKPGEKLSRPAKLPLQIPPLYLFQVCKWQWDSSFGWKPLY